MAASVGWAGGSLFSYLPERERRHLLDLGKPRPFRPAEVLMWHGDPSNHVFLLVSGWVRVSQASRYDQEILLALRGPGDVLGDLAALFGEPRSATIRALTRLEVVQLTSDQFGDSLHSHPVIAIAMVKQMGMRLREAESARTQAATLDVSERVAEYLFWLFEKHSQRNGDGFLISMPLTQQDIASRVGASLRQVARSLRLLRDRHIIRTKRRQFVIVQPDVLRSFDPSTSYDTDEP